MKGSPTVAPFSFHFPSLAGAFYWLRSRQQGSQDDSVFKDGTSRAQDRQQSVESGWEFGEGEGKQRISSTQGSILDFLNRFPLSFICTITWMVLLPFLNGGGRD